MHSRPVPAAAALRINDLGETELEPDPTIQVAELGSAVRDATGGAVVNELYTMAGSAQADESLARSVATTPCSYGLWNQTPAARGIQDVEQGEEVIGQPQPIIAEGLLALSVASDAAMVLSSTQRVSPGTVLLLLVTAAVVGLVAAKS